MVRLHGGRELWRDHAQQHSVRVCGRRQAGKLTWASPSVGKHGAAAPDLVRARTLPSSARSATLLQPRRRTTPLLRERLGRSTSGLKPYIDRIKKDTKYLVRSTFFSS